MKIVKPSIMGDSADVFLSGEVGTDFTAKQIKAELSEVGDVAKLNVYIDSIGGFYDEGIEIYMAFSIHPAYITTHVQGMANSMASIIALVGQERFIAANSWVMLHEVTGSAGIQEANGRMTDIYASNTGLSRADLIDMVSTQTWLDSGQAVDCGFSDFITPPVPFHNEASYLKYRTSRNHLASKYESFSGAKAKRKSQRLKNQMAYARNKAATIKDQRELCAQYNITPETFNLIMNQED